MENTSGQGEAADVPRTYIAFLCVVPVIGFVMMFVLGMRGNEWAWQNRRWESVEEFQNEQKIWSKWGIRLAKILIILAILGFILNPILKLLVSLHYL
jgi:hypothetical protein